MTTSQARSLFYANLPSDGQHHLENAAHFQLKEFRRFLQTARAYQQDEGLLRVGWQPDGAPLQDGSEWCQLIPCGDQRGEPDAIFEEFLSEATNAVYECAPPGQSVDGRARTSFLRPDHRITVLRHDVPLRRLLLERAPLFSELVTKPDTYTLNRQISAIDRLRSEPAAAHAPLLRLLQSRHFADEHWPMLATSPEPPWRILTDATRDGTQEQRTFVRGALATPDFFFLEGPPGSGKTTAICELILHAVNAGKRVLLSASTHVAVDNVLERIADDRYPEVIAVRIDRRDDERTPERVRGLRLDSFVASERGRLREFHARQAQPSPAQKLFQRGLDAKTEGEKMVERLILDSANLVAGTTIGILQHPDIKAAGKGRGAEPPFDMLIVDEASKTTFQEFLVPALWAKRWVLVGDPRQLSPYADEGSLAPNIRACLPQEWKRQFCLVAAEARHRDVADEGKVLVNVADDLQADFLFQQTRVRASDARVEYLNDPGTSDDATGAFRLAGATVVAGRPEDFTRHRACVPLDISRLIGDFAEGWHARLAAWLAHAEIDSDEQKTWEAEIAWRLGRDYELRWLPERERPDYLAQIDRLLPFDDEEAVREGVLRVGRLALPSVLESLMIGVGGRASMGDREVITARSDGLGSLGGTRRDIYAERSQRLTFQHRMHPEISTMPRRLFYNNEALHDAKGLGARPWGCDCFGDYRAVWVPVDGSLSGNANEREAREVVRQLERFLRWADANPHHNGAAWEIAVLTFYLGQESALRSLLDASDLARTGYGSYAQAGRSGASTATVKLCTVDSFQGHEADIVFLSFVQTRKVGFLRSLNRLNVAVTRARHQLVLVGAQRFFASPRCDSALLGELASLPANEVAL